MQVQSYSGQRYQGSTHHPVAMGAIIVVHAAALTALLMAKSGYIPDIPAILIADPISIDQADPPPPPPTAEPDAPHVRSRIDTPDRQVKSVQDEVVLLGPTTIDPLSPGPSDGAGTKAADPPLPVPVLVDPRVDPRFADALQPPYPPAKQRLGEEGRVSVKVLVGTDGRVKAVTLLSATDDAFFAATERQALRYWRFRPATRDGVPVEGWRTMTVRFEIGR